MSDVGLSAEQLVFEHFRSPNGNMDQPYPVALRSILNMQEFRAAKAVIEALPWYSPTPLHPLNGLAAQLGVAKIHFKDESTRFGLRAFKGLGGAYAVFRLLELRAEQMGLGKVSIHDLLAKQHPEIASKITVACATTGNHGRSVARAAQIFGCRCVIYVPPTASQGRVDALEALGAVVVRTLGNYDDAVRRAEDDARNSGWFIISDTAYEGHASTPRDVMHGYRVIVDEVVRQLSTEESPTHVFVQTGVGGIAAAFCSHFWEAWGSTRPRFVVVESRHACCMLRSAQAGQAVTVQGALNTRMYGLAAGKPSSLAWEILSMGANDFVSIDDAASFFAMRLLACGMHGDPPLIAGEAGAAGLGALIVALSNDERRRALGLDRTSRVLLIGTEGATDPATYAEIVGRSPEQVLNFQPAAYAHRR